MGCCESTPISTHPTKPTTTPPPPPPQPKPALITHPQPQPEEEETVKEVLSETPISKPPPPPPQITNPNPRPDVKPKKIEPIGVTKPTEQEISLVSEISEASEFCSFSGSFSTTTVNEKDDGEVTQRVGPRSPAKTPRKCTYSGEVKRERGPTRSKRGGHSQVVRSSRPVAQGRANTTPHRRNVGLTSGAVKRDSGELSLRRSRSPAPRGEKGGPGGRTVGQRGVTGGGVTGQAGGKSPVRKVDESQRKVEKQDDAVLGENGSESLENPLVSLECFIFL
ncbi:hypothetical protein DCAR_0310993 [Daucus carota subsp. sativus]|uniref:Uncharacterized protein n=1 Tax=Daucus carota subsp. sativus TaxID=79200 RepID=A0A162AH37_DAUCS|nr:PREDICTED: serine/arginine repetitive matrix protein 1-like [Daucus carota subsp. sativus]WOG91743.1 hypothetical protein DCAR_0310993 [Daucus carota subsp. sativus]